MNKTYSPGVHSSPGAPILKKKGMAATISFDEREMGSTHVRTINELESEDLARSGALIEESVKDPNQNVRVIPELTEFLIEEYYKKYGIHTNEKVKLFQFWK